MKIVELLKDSESSNDDSADAMLHLLVQIEQLSPTLLTQQLQVMNSACVPIASAAGVNMVVVDAEFEIVKSFPHSLRC